MQEREMNFEYNTKSKSLIVNDEEKDIQWLKDVIKCYSLEVGSRIKMTENGENLDILVEDEDWRVRQSVAEHSRDKYLDILVNDKNKYVQQAVAQHGREKDLDILVKDENWYIRYLVAQHGREKDLDILVKDKDWHVRLSVASKGYGLDILINDENEHVREVVEMFMNKNNINSIEEYIENKQYWYNKIEKN